MRLATTEQLALLRKRRVRALAVELGAFLVAPIPAIAVLVSLGEQSVVSRVTSAATFLVVAFSGQVARRIWFHCPACNGPLPRGPRQVPFGELAVTQCSMCRTRFED